MAHRDDAHGDNVRPRTAVLTRGYDPTLSLGSARPAVFRSSTYVFPSPEAAERWPALAWAAVAGWQVTLDLPAGNGLLDATVRFYTADFKPARGIPTMTFA